MSRQRLYRAFTLVEILLVIVIIGVLAGMLVTRLSGRTQEARIARAQSDIRGQLSLALKLFEQDTGRYPTDDEGLAALMENPGMEGWRGPYLEGELRTDPWNKAYLYRLDPEHPGMYLLLSSGPDGQAGTQDDIK
jgi:general secretion pathway protein G